MVRSRHFTVRACASPLAFPRAGIIVPRHGRTAVARNRLKRRLREVIRLDLLPLDASWDVILRAAPKAYELSFTTLRAELGDTFQRLLAVKPKAT